MGSKEKGRSPYPTPLRCTHWYAIHLIKPNDAPDPIGCFVEALKAIKTIRGVVNEKPLLYETGGGEDEACSKPAKTERDRRDLNRERCKELSQYYSRSKGLWRKPGLLKKGKHGTALCTGDIQLTRFPTSGRRFGKPPRPPTKPGSAEAGYVEVDGGGSSIPPDTRRFSPPISDLNDTFPCLSFSNSLFLCDKYVCAVSRERNP